MTDDRIYSFTGSVFLEYDQAYTELAGGTPVMLPRQLSVFKSSSTEQYQGMRYRDMRQRKQLNIEQLDVSSSQAWSQTRIGISNQTFVSQPISSSRHEVQNKGCFLSGTEKISTGPIPFSASMYYEKSFQLQKSIYKWVATVGDGGYNATFGNQIKASASVEFPHHVGINIPDYGSIVDIRVWVEIMQPSSSAGVDGHPHLGQLGIALRSPNVSFESGHPIRNFTGYGGNPATHFSPANQEFTLLTKDNILEFYKSTYLLWESSPVATGSHVAFGDPYAGSGGDDWTVAGSALRMPVWDRDMGMRTIFSDGASTKNPRNIIDVYSGTYPSVLAVGTGRGSPNAGATDGVGTAIGNGFGWYSDTDFGTPADAAGSPPPGWLTGAGGTAGPLEYPTTGINYGPHEIQALYPMLDEVISKKIYHNEGVDSLTLTNNWTNWRSWIGHRPGLRDTEMKGNWTLLIANAETDDPCTTYLRQWRLEITYRQNIDARATIIPPRRPRRSGGVDARPGLVLKSVISGSHRLAIDLSNVTLQSLGAPADYFPNAIYVLNGYELENNRTIGMTDDLQEFERQSYAVYTAPVAVSYGTGSYSRALVNTVLSPGPLFSGPKTISSVIRAGVNETTEQTAMRLLNDFSGSNVILDS